MNEGRINITDHLFNFADDFPDKHAVLYPEKITFSGLTGRIDQYASFLLQAGVREKTKTIVLVSPGIELFALVYALLRIGAIPIMIDPGMGYRAMVLSLSSCGAEAFIGISKSHVLRVIYRKAFKSVKHYFSSGRFFIPGAMKIPERAKKMKSDYPRSTPGIDDTAAIFYTSGSTGPAKPVVYTVRMLQAQIAYMKNHFKYCPDDVDLCTFPLIGLLVLSHGISVVFADMDMTRPGKAKPDKIIQNLHRYSCTSMFCSPMILEKITFYGRSNKILIPALSKVFTAGAPVSPALLKDFRDLLLEAAIVHTPFGSTEALSVTDITDLELISLYDETLANIEGMCVGSSLDEIELKIIDIKDEPIEHIDDCFILSEGTVGEIIVTGPNVSQEYYYLDEANRMLKIADRIEGVKWHRTGDLGRMDAEGRIWFYGRKSHRVESIFGRHFTIPCEAVFNKHPDVRRSALVGITQGNDIIPAICIELKDHKLRSEDLKKELIALADGYDHTNCISRIFFIRKFPVDPRHNAKINRELLAARIQNMQK